MKIELDKVDRLCRNHILNDTFLTRVFDTTFGKMMYSNTDYMSLSGDGVFHNDTCFTPFDEGLIPMLCFGFPDCKGNIIYADDIIKLPDNNLYLLKHYPAKGGFCLMSSPSEGILFQYEKHFVEVVGNIHENLKLIKGLGYENR